MIEQNTNYAFKLKYMGNPSFEKVRDLSTRFYRELPKELQDELYEALNRGVDILDSEPQMVTYLHAFGPMHQAKLNYAFKHLPEEFLAQPEINIIDYGCGQALGTMCYADFLHKNGYSQKVNAITLIEPSEMCLKRAALHASVFFPDAEIKTICKTFDDLDDDDICYDEDTPTLHILSNVLDMLDFDLNSFSNLLNECLNGYNQFVCVGPYYGFSENDIRMEEFCTQLQGDTSFYINLNKYELQADKAWTARILCFSVGELKEEISTKVTAEDLANAIEDEFGVLYSKDGKKIIGFGKTERAGKYPEEYGDDIKNYSIKEGTTIICDYAFFINLDPWGACLENIFIPESITTIGNYAFKWCDCLSSICLPNSIMYISPHTFDDIPYLKRIIVPKGNKERFLKMIDKELWNIVVEEPPNFVKNEEIVNGVEDEFGVVYNRDGKRLLKCKNYELTEYTIKEGSNVICDDAFASCTSLQHITIPDSVTIIGDWSFAGCKSLQQFIIPNSVTGIGHSTFSDCTTLKQIIIPNSITRIDAQTFCRCMSLEKIIIPNSVTSIGKWAFSVCQSLQQIIIPDSVTSIGDDAFWDCRSLQHIIIAKVSVGKFKQLLPTELWDKLYYLEKADVNSEDMDNDLPF